MKTCWRCEAQLQEDGLECETCRTLQPFAPGTDYFNCLGLTRLLQIDGKDLEQRFYERSRIFHPDFFNGKEEREKDISLENSALLNKAYRTLRDPISRLEYLVELEAGDKKEITAKVPQEFLEEVFELQESLDEFRSTTDSVKREKLEGRLRESLKMLEGRLAELDQEFSEGFARWDRMIDAGGKGARSPDQAALVREMRERLSFRTFFNNLIDDIEHLLQGNLERREIRH